MKITLRQLRVFDAIASSGSVSLAASTLHMTQSAASMSLKDLESRLGAKLFHRRAKRLTLNDYGAWLQPMVHNVLHSVEAIESSAGSRDLRGTLSVGASSTIGNYLLPSIINGFVETHTGVSAEMKVGNTEQIISALLSMQIDLGFIEGHCDRPHIRAQRWREDQLVVIAATSHPLAHEDQVSEDQLTEYPWILREPGSGTREVFSHGFKGLIDRLHISLELSNSEAIKRAVTSGQALSCLSLLAVESELTHGDLQVLPTPFLGLRRDLYVLRRADDHVSRLSDAFCEFAEGRIRGEDRMVTNSTGQGSNSESLT